MSTPPDTQLHWLVRPQNIKLLWRGFIGVLVLTVLAEFFVHLHPHFEIESWFGFHAVYGFVVCLLMIVVAKGLGLLIKRPDTFYDEERPND